MSDPAEQLITCEKVAQFCGVPENTVIKWVSSGNLNSHEFEGAQRISIAELIQFMNQHDLAVPLELIEAKKQPVQQADTVLIVVKDRASAHTIKGVMQGLSLKTNKVDSRLAAAEHIQHKMPALITVDLDFGDTEGIQLLENIAAYEDSKVKVLVITDSIPSLVARAKAAGADAIIPKPFDVDTLKRSTKILLSL